jgi:hypothetical protein
MCIATVIGLASCTGTDNMPSATLGGPGSVVSLNNDAGHADGARDFAMQMSSTGGQGGTVLGTGGISAGSGGSAGSPSAGGAGGAAGSVTPDDPCTACEKARCGNPDLSLDVGPPENSYSYGSLAGAYEVCFIGTGWPSADAPPNLVCGAPQSDLLPTATNGPASGTAKTTLCQALLKCVHQTNCLEGEDNDFQLECYCGAGVSLSTCESAGFTPTGACVPQIAAALEVTDYSTSTDLFGDLCLAYGAAMYIYNQCDGNCCETECGLTPSGYEDPTFCNAAATGGASGSGGTTGTGGVTGSGGTTGTGGVTGSGGTTGTGGVTGSGGTTGTGGAHSSGGTVGSTGGLSGTGGTTSTGGVHGSGGTVGSTGGSSGTGGAGGLQNGTFNSNTTAWAPSSGATANWNAEDAGGSAQSGSLDLTTTGDSTISLQAAAAQCISATSGTTYNLGVEILIPMGSTSYASLWFYGSNDCSGSALSVVASTPTFPTTTAWQEVSASTVAPSGAHSVAVQLQVVKSTGQTSAEALFDNVSVTAQ